MANNPYVNKVVYGNDTLLDLTGDTVTAGDMLSGVTAHDRSGAAITGNLVPVLGVEVNGTTHTPDNNGVVDIGTVITSLQDGTTSQKGVVQLEDSTSSTSTTKAATPNSVKAAYDLASGKASASSGLSLTLASGSWGSATPPTQTITATGVTASNNIIVGIGSGITSAQYDAACAAKLVCTAQGANSITVTAYGTEPTENIPISVVILG